MEKQRRQYNEQFKFEVGLEAAKGLRTANEIAGAYQVHPNQVSSWKKKLLEEGANDEHVLSAPAQADLVPASQGSDPPAVYRARLQPVW